MTISELHKTIHEKDVYIEQLQEQINTLKQSEFEFEWEKRALLNKVNLIEQKLQNALFESSISSGMISKLNALKAEIEELKSQIKSGKSKIRRTERKVEGLTSERNNLAAERDSLIDQREELLEKIDSQGRTIDELKEKQSGALAIKEILERTEQDLQDAHEELSRAKEDLSQAHWEIANKENQLNEALATISSKDSRISEMHAEIEKLKKELASSKVDNTNDGKNDIFVPEPETAVNVSTNVSGKDDGIFSEDVVETSSLQLSQEGNEDDNKKYLPQLKGQEQASKRSIETVIDLESDEEIDAEEFFSRDKEEIARISRYLAESDALGKDVYVCAKCQNRVKVAKREISGKGEVLFFAHCHKDITCDWKKEHSYTDDYVDYDGNDVEPVILPNKVNNDVRKYRDIKDVILNSLISMKERRLGVSEVEEDLVIKSEYRFMRWRRACVYAKYNGKSIVFELQTRNVLMHSIVNKDMFYRLHNHHVIWIFGADEESGYDYVQRHAHQNTMFFNRRNVFFVDEDTIAESKNRGELVLKCNYLDADDKWHFRKETTRSNGIFVTLSDLKFDDEMCKPYYFDANRLYFDLYPLKEEEYKASIHSREEIIEDLQYKFDNPVIKESANRNSAPKSTHHKPRHLVEKIPVGNDKYIYGVDKKWGLITGEGEVLIDLKYDEIQHWSDNKYRVKILDKWGIITEDNTLLLEVIYHSVGNLIDGKSLVNTGIREFYIDSSCHELDEKVITLFNGLTKFKKSGKWGIKDLDGNVIIDCQYDEIGSFRSRLIGFINGKAIKLTTVYDYRVPVEGKCIGRNDSVFIYKVGNVECKFDDKRQVPEDIKMSFSAIGSENTMALVNILWNDDAVFLRSMEEKDWEVPFNHVDNSYDFLVGEVLEATVTNILYGKRLILSFPDGRESYMSKTMAAKSGIPYSSLVVGLSMTVKKIGFDDVYDRTLWEVVKI